MQNPWGSCRILPDSETNPVSCELGGSSVQCPSTKDTGLGGRLMGVIQQPQGLSCHCGSQERQKDPPETRMILGVLAVRWLICSALAEKH